MGMLPNVLHFKVAMYLSVLMGVWPLITSKNTIIGALYELMSKLYFVYFHMFIVTQVIQLTLLLLEEEVNYGEVTNNLSVGLVYINSAVRCRVIKGRVMKKVISDINQLEQKLWNSLDKGINKIYKENAKMNNLFCTLFAGNTILISIVYTIWPFFVENQTVEIDNVTVEVKYLPVSAWVPFDEQKHYVTAYVMLLFNANYMGTMFFVSTETLAFGLMSYPIGQIRILKHVLKNFRKYRGELQKKLNLTDDVASEYQLRECIIHHQDIIKYVDNFNAEMKHTYLLDFMQCSFQLTCILYRFLQNQNNLALILINLQFLFAMLIRLFITYWTANEIILQSGAVSMELYNMEWLDETQKVKKIILFMMMRAQRPLKLYIGMFKTMSLEAIITILKITYSYISLFYSSTRGRT